MRGSCLKFLDVRVDGFRAAEFPCDEGGDGEGGGDFPAEEFDAEGDGGDGGVGGGGEEGDHADGREEVDGCAEKPCEGVSEGGTDEEEWGDFAAFEACGEGDDGEDHFPEPSGGGGVCVRVEEAREG